MYRRERIVVAAGEYAIDEFEQRSLVFGQRFAHDLTVEAFFYVRSVGGGVRRSFASVISCPPIGACRPYTRMPRRTTERESDQAWGWPGRLRGWRISATFGSKKR